MKDNTAQAHKLLIDAFKSLPGDFSLREVRFHLNQAIQKLKKVEENRLAATKKQEKKTNSQTWSEMIRNGVQNPYTSGRTVDIINDMLADEQRKLEAILKQRENAANKAKNPQPQDDEDGDTLFG